MLLFQMHVISGKRFLISARKLDHRHTQTEPVWREIKHGNYLNAKPKKHNSQACAEPWMSYRTVRYYIENCDFPNCCAVSKVFWSGVRTSLCHAYGGFSALLIVSHTYNFWKNKALMKEGIWGHIGEIIETLELTHLDFALNKIVLLMETC